jgi:hypothetical protein
MATYNFKKQAEIYLATNYDVESGMTVSNTLAPNTSITTSGSFSNANRLLNVLMAGEVVLPSSFSNGQECLAEHGGTGSGFWLGVKTLNSVLTFQMRAGTGTAGSTETNATRVVANIPVSDIPEFDGKMHTVAWEFSPGNGTVKFWIDNRLVLSEVTTDGDMTQWSGGNAGGWLKGFDGIAGYTDGTQESADHRTAWSGQAGSDLRIYNNQTIGNNNYPLRLDVTEDLKFSQTFTDSTYAQKTVHEQHKMHEASNIKKANPASFDFTVPALTENDLAVVKDLLVDYKTGTNTLNTFTLHIKLPNDTYRLDNCVITNGTFIIEKLENLKLGIQGQASRLVKGVALPTSGRVTRSASSTHQRIDYLSVSVDSTALTEGVYKVSVELQNEIEWTPYLTVNDALNVTNAATSMYPSNFTLKKRILSGSIGQYVQSNFNSDTQQWKTGAPIVIKAGESATTGFQFDLTNCAFTNRNDVLDVFTQSYDWKMNDNPTDLGSKIKFNNL